MRRLAVANQKGGSGKTTTAVNLAAAFAAAGRSVVLLDLDPQGSASAWLGVRAAGTEGKGVADVFLDEAKVGELVLPTAVAGLDVVPSSPWLVSVERAAAGEPGIEMILGRAIDELDARYDLMVIDSPPSLGLLTVAALVAASEVVVPVQARAMPLDGLASLLQLFERVKSRLHPTLELGSILACQVNRTRLAVEVVAQLRTQFGPVVLETVIRENVRLAEAPSHRQPIGVYAPDSPGAADYAAAALELLGVRTGG